MLKRSLFLFVALLYTAVIAAQQNNTFLWRINNPYNKQSSYLFGTIHLPQEKFMSLTDSVYRAVMNTDFFYGELNYQDIYKEMNDTDGFFQSKLDYLDSVKKTAAWKKMIAVVNRNYNTSINPDSINEFTEFGQNQLEEFMKPDPGVKALDLQLSAYAITLGKKNRGLETFKFQVDMLYKIIEARLADTTLLFNDDVILAANMKRLYATQQFDSMASLIEIVHPTYRKIVFDNRNKVMADSIQQATKNNTAFFAVGCGHLMGASGIISLLKAKGLTVTPVFSNNRLSITVVKNMMQGLKKTMNNASTPVDPPDEKIEEIKEDMQIIVAPKEKTPAKKSKNTKQ